MIKVQKLTPEQIQEFISWKYDGPYALYNISADNPEEQLAFFQDPVNGYFAITGPDGEFLGFCNFGTDARVPGGNYEEAAIDIGMGMRPDLTGQGQGQRYAAAVFDFAGEQYPDSAFRVTIAEFNKRAQRLCEKFGFRISDHFRRTTDRRPFVIMTRA